MNKLYVNPNGNDSNGIGTIDNPYQTISKALSMTTGDTILYLSNGIHTVYSLLDMSVASKNIVYYGNGIDTIIEVQYCYTNGSFKNIMAINNCRIRPSNNFTGDTRAISYTGDSYEITFNNVLFTRSLNSSYPTTTMFYCHPNTYNFACNKIFNYCTFIYDISYIVTLGACTFKNCTTNYSVINHPSITAEIETNTQYNQSYDSKYSLLNNDNTLYGVYALNSIWYTGGFLLLKNKKYYTIKDNTLLEVAPIIDNTFILSDLDNDVSKKLFKLHAPFKLVLINNVELSSINFIIDNSFILINLSNINHSNIRTGTEHKMLCSNDLKTWDNYYDNSNYNSVYVEDYQNYYIKNYINDNCKPIKGIDASYNYILIRLNEGENFDKLFEEVILDYKKMDIDSSYTTGTDNKTMITVPNDCKGVIVKLNKHGKRIIIKDTMGEF